MLGQKKIEGLSLRKAAILTYIAKSYIATAVPVASEVVASHLGWKVSPATVRKEMASLEEEGYLTRLHISAGSIPADQGYRFYVQQHLDASELPLEEQLAMRQRFNWADQDMEAWTRLTALILSELVHNLAVATFPRPAEFRMRRVELVGLQECLVLVVLVLQEARLLKRLVPLREPVQQDELVEVANKLNASYAGLSPREMVAKPIKMTPLEEQILQSAMHLIEEEGQEASDHYLVEGLRHLLAQPEFTATQQVRDLVEALEERRLVQALLLRTPEVGGLRVVIGAENQDMSLKPLSIVVAQYGVSGRMTGTVGIIGPTRMEYEKTVAGVRYLSSLMSELVEGVHGYAAFAS